MVSQLKNFKINTQYRLYFYLAIVAILILSNFSYFFLKRSFVDYLFREARKESKIIKQNIGYEIDLQVTRVQELSKTNIVIQFLRNKSSQQVLKQFLEKHKFFYDQNLIIFSSKGQRLFSSKNLANSFSPRIIEELLKKSLILYNPIISNFYLTEKNNEQSLLILQAVTDGNEILGALAFEIPKNVIKAQLERFANIFNLDQIIIGINNQDKELSSVIINIKKLSDNNKTEKTDQYAIDSYLTKASQGKNGVSAKSENLSNSSELSQFIWSWQYIPTTQWGLVVKINFKQAVRSFVVFKIFIYLVNFIFSLLLIYSLYKVFTKS